MTRGNRPEAHAHSQIEKGVRPDGDLNAGDTEQRSVPAREGLSPSDQAKLDRLRGEVQEAQDEIDRGEGIWLDSVDEIFALVGIRRGLADVEAGNVTPLKRFEQEFRQKRGLPGRPRRHG